ncbi:hypothetical protein HN858_01320 [Candidatus Falkowbacteria bacterium]|jgi:hypothetical protein|nr:hypothetical protein [Candidatus Falkowbacteria bacterium]MBT5502768.1 hypothetical protein [Candidatus Falkowbacteria bacterium]MBT6573449.1 hypothetical protein [Candidatus Falkowbacteria bacterium]MBT7348294.1 hypothetical protein [Candidatus Falkowbacteria bacterium]MBT7501166.1 hypothetical protein [Candidatus Falkowbacteria bacterium]
METKLTSQSLMKLVQVSKQVLGLNLAPISAEPVSLISVEEFVSTSFTRDVVFLCIGPDAFLKCRAGYLNKGQLTLIAKLDSSAVDVWKQAVKEGDSDISLSHSSVIPSSLRDKVKFPPPQMTEEEKVEAEENQRRLSEAEQERKVEQARKVEQRKLKETAATEKKRLAEIAGRKREEEEARKRRKEAIARQAEEIRQGLIFLCPNCSQEVAVDAEVCNHCQEKLARCPHCDRFILKSLFDQEYPYCPHEQCGRSLHKSICPECNSETYLDMEACVRCGKNLLMISCPNDKCVDHLGKPNRIYAGSSKCVFCEKKLKTCHHCENLIEASCYEQEDPRCPVCAKSLKLVTCPFCRSSVYSNLKKCTRCGKPLQVIQCPNKDCLDKSGNRNLIYKNSSQCIICEMKIKNCPHCEKSLSICPYCQTQIFKRKEDKNQDCPNCSGSLAKKACPGCGHQNYTEALRCTKCKQLLAKMHCPSCNKLIWRGYSRCPECEKHIAQCNMCKDWFVQSTRESRCSKCQELRSG